MPKKTMTARSGAGAQRNKPKVQKSFELVRQVSDKQELEPTASVEATPVSVSTMVPPSEVQPVETTETSSSVSTAASTGTTTTARSTTTTTTTVPNNRGATTAPDSTEATTAPKKSAATRLAAQRQASQKAQLRAAASLITSEHYAYVRRDLLFIAILAVIMFAAIIVLHFVPGIGS